MPLMEFLRENILLPAGITEAADVDDGPLGQQDAAGYLRYGLGPLHQRSQRGEGLAFRSGLSSP